MRRADVQRAIAAARAEAAALGVAHADDAVVIHDSNRLVLRLTPCDVVARVTPLTHHAGHHASARREAELVDRLTRIGSPVARLDPRTGTRVLERDGFAITLWAFHPTVDGTVPPAAYARALADLHAGLRQVDLPLPHVVDRIAGVAHDLADRALTPDLADGDRTALADTLGAAHRAIAAAAAAAAAGHRAPDQPLHGEPHPWNLLTTAGGPLFVDFENAARGPVEYDLAWVPTAVADLHTGADRDLLGVCRGVVLAMITAYRWRHDDEHPSGRRSGVAFLDALRAGPPWPPCDQVTW